MRPFHLFCLHIETCIPISQNTYHAGWLCDISFLCQVPISDSGILILSAQVFLGIDGNP